MTKDSKTDIDIRFDKDGKTISIDLDPIEWLIIVSVIVSGAILGRILGII